MAEATFSFAVSEKEKNLIELLRKLQFGEVRVVVQDSCPVRAEEIRKSVKL